ncbi:hypothetical protein AMTRI_Chr08g203330 [Amborella trichopoda]
MSKKHTHKNSWKRKGYKVTMKVFSLGKYVPIEHSNSSFVQQTTTDMAR